MVTINEICQRLFKKSRILTASVLLAVILIAASLYYLQTREVKAAIQKSKVLIISNDDTYSTAFGNNTGRTSVYDPANTNGMDDILRNYGFDVTVWAESANGNGPPTVAYANNFDVVIFTQGVGYRSTANGKNGLNLNDLNFLKQYLNITASGNKSRLIIEGEDVMSDILRVGTSTDQRDVLKITTSSSADNYGKMTNLRISDTTHPVFNHVYSLTTNATGVTVTNQTTFQDYIAANLSVGAKTVGEAKFTVSATYRTTLNTWSGSSGSREVFMPFSWYIDANNGIQDKDWRDKLLINMVSWVGERKINVTGSDIADATTSPGSTMGMLSVQLTPESTVSSYTYTSMAIRGMKIVYTGNISGAELIANNYISAYVYEDTGNIGTLEAGDVYWGGASFSETVGSFVYANVYFAPERQEHEITATRNIIVAYKFNGNAPIGKTAGARLANYDSVITHVYDKLSRAYPVTFTYDSTQTTITTGGTATIKAPANGSTVRSNVTITGTTSTEYNLKYASNFDNRSTNEANWTQFAYGASAVNNTTLGNWNTTVIPDGQYTVRLKVYSGVYDYKNFYIDNTAPVLSGVTYTDVQDNHATFTWTTDEPATSEIVYSTDPTFTVFNTYVNSAKVQSHSETVSGLSANTTYYYKVKSADAAGNISPESAPQTFTTLDQGPFASITYPAVIAEITPRVGSTIQIKGSALTVNPGHSIVYSVYYGYGDSKEKVTTWNHVYSSSNSVNSGVLATWTTPAPDGLYVLKLRVVDPALTGLTSYEEDYVTVIVDNSMPEITGFGVHSITNVSACVYWETSKSTTDQVVYGSNPGVYPFVLNDTEKDRMMYIYDLSPGKTYYYKILATDGSGHTAEIPEQSFTTTNLAGDTTPPVISAVYLTAAGRTESTVDLRWNAATDASGVAGYKIYYSIDGETFSFRGAVPGIKLTYTDTGLSASTAYWYRLTAFDTLGNESVPTAAIKVETVAAYHNNPHGAYQKLTVMCSKCHTTHRGKKEFLFNKTQEATMCYICHDAAGTGSKYAIEAEYTPDHTSRHPLPMEHTSKECASCHNPHLNPATYPRLLWSHNNVTGVVYSSENGFCYNCHGINGPDRILDNTAGAHDVFETSMHNGPTFPEPESGSKVKCELCHENHASEDVRLTKAPEEENCYHCHGDTSDQFGIPNIKKNLNRVSFHNVNGTEATGKVECVNCHNPHYVQGGALNTSDPYDTNDLWTGDRSTFCISCHDGDDPPQRHVNRNENVPYTVYFPTTPFYPTNYYYGNQTRGGYNKSLFVDDLDNAHYYWNGLTNGVQCTQCHDPHGSDGKRLLARSEDSVSSAQTGICVNCHSDNGTWKSTYTTAPSIFSEMTNVSSHPTLFQNSTDAHSGTEDYAAISVANRHAECWDCHDPHLARKASVFVGNMPGPLYNVSGVKRVSGSLTFTNPATEAWQVCYKCHSGFWTNLGAAGKRDIAAEFYRTGTYYSYHFVERTSNPNVSTNTTGHFTAGATDRYGNAWTYNSKMFCTDCHGTPTGAKGPHGSVYEDLLKGKYWDYLNDATIDTRAEVPTDFLCFNCHDSVWYKNNTNHGEGKSDHSIPCWQCHGERFHGTNATHLIRVRNTGVGFTHPDYESKSVVTGTDGNPRWSLDSSCTSATCTGGSHP